MDFSDNASASESGGHTSDDLDAAEMYNFNRRNIIQQYISSDLDNEEAPTEIVEDDSDHDTAAAMLYTQESYTRPGVANSQDAGDPGSQEFEVHENGSDHEDIPEFPQPRLLPIPDVSDISDIERDSIAPSPAPPSLLSERDEASHASESPETSQPPFRQPPVDEQFPSSPGTSTAIDARRVQELQELYDKYGEDDDLFYTSMESDSEKEGIPRIGGFVSDELELFYAEQMRLARDDSEHDSDDDSEDDLVQQQLRRLEQREQEAFIVPPDQDYHDDSNSDSDPPNGEAEAEAEATVVQDAGAEGHQETRNSPAPKMLSRRA